MKKQEITEKITQCVAESLVKPIDQVKTTSSLINDLGADSLDFLDIMFALERTFNITVGKEQFDLLHKVGLSKEEAISGQSLTPLAIDKLRPLLPNLPKSGEIPVNALRDFITIETIVFIVESLIQEKLR